MKTNSRIISVLYIVSRLTFRFSQLILLFILVFECIPSGTLGSWSSSIHHTKGYKINTQIQLSVPDSLIIYKSKINKGSGFVSKSETKKINDHFNRVKKDTTLKKTYQINTYEIYNKNFVDVKQEFKNLNIQGTDSTLEIIINPKDYFFKSILILKNYLYLIVLLFVSYQCMRLFNQLRDNFAFDMALTQRIQKIGYSLIAYPVINLIFCYIIMQYFSRINYYHYTNSIYIQGFNFMNLTPVLEYNLQTLFLGLSLVVLGKLLNHGYNLQNENDLTI
ncbi:DUF2975 domain-containing protein [Flavobacterium chungbukense]|uniref:DUF2975 domain-containing protein n=1 Tax=Flavobacterium chungbukense TaxID=877464 RepID=A0ABP7Y1F1_9FLAO|nr:DUF2975 domain-containing protein [Flavobacterium chungbukense]MCC4922218.1 DUF2975 domain-containing protein [Flavobacterium chungbukense]